MNVKYCNVIILECDNILLSCVNIFIMSSLYKHLWITGYADDITIQLQFRQQGHLIIPPPALEQTCLKSLLKQLKEQIINSHINII